MRIKKRNIQMQYLGNYFGELISENLEESDRAAAILLVAELDELLLKILEKYLLPKSSKNSNDLLSSASGLGTFSTRIEIAYRLGLINKISAYDLRLLKNIRNIFAHRTRGISFESQEIKDIIHKFRTPKLKKGDGNPLFIDAANKKSRSIYESIAYFSIGYLSDIYEKTKPIEKNKLDPDLEKFLKL